MPIQQNIASQGHANGPITSITLLCLLLFYSQGLFAQHWQDTLSSDYEQDLFTRAREIQKEARGTRLSLDLLALRLSAKAKTDFEKLWLLYHWIGNNISYDHSALGAHQTAAVAPVEVLQTRKALCEGYSLLFETLCKKMDMPCRSISGYSKGDGYRRGQVFTRSDHSWNVVWWQNRWHPIDVTWAACSTSGKSVNFDYLLSPPLDFLSTHLPEDPHWQLLPFSLSLKSFHKESLSTDTLLLSLPAEHIGLLPDSAEINQHYLWEVEKNTRIHAFNPHKANAPYWLAQSWLYVALDLRDSMYHFSLDELLVQDSILLDRFRYFLAKADSAMSDFCSLQPENRTCFTFMQEKLFQRGIFHYELASFMLWGLKDWYDTQPARYQSQHKKVKAAAARHYTHAEDWVRQVDKRSIYHQEAQKILLSIAEARRDGL